MNRLKELRLEHSLTQDDIGRELGVGKSTISKYEKGTVALPQRAIEKLCDLFQVPSDILLGRVEALSYDEAITPSADNFVGVPLLGRVHAGAPILANENIEDYIPNFANAVSGGDYFYMRVDGDCMTGDFIPEGALVLVRKQSHVNNNDIAVVRIEDEVVLRHVKYVDDHIVLVPSNPIYEPMIVTGGDVEIIGHVCEVRFSI